MAGRLCHRGKCYDPQFESPCSSGQFCYKGTMCGEARDHCYIITGAPIPQAPLSAMLAVPPGSQTAVRNSPSCSDITGTGGPPADRTSCDQAKKLVKSARDERQQYPERAQKKYQDAAKTYRKAGDEWSAAMTLREAAAEDLTPFLEAETDAAEKDKNLAEAANLAQIAYKIEQGAYESNSCGDLLMAANYYLQAALHYLRAHRFAIVNAILLRKDALEAMVDEAKQKGGCGQRPAVPKQTPQAEATALPPEELIEPDKCRVILTQLAHMEGKWRNRFERWAVLVELKARGCSDPAAKPFTNNECDKAWTHWHQVGRMKEDEMKRLLLAASCPKFW